MQNTRVGYLKNLNARHLDFHRGNVYDVRITFSLEIKKKVFLHKTMKKPYLN